MIIELTVENLAIIERSQLVLGPGFTVLTGETGAGKSLLIDAIELAFGARADSDLVRAGAPRASVSVVLDLTNQPALRAYCAESGFAVDEGTLFLQREVFAEGRSQCRIGGRLAPVSALRQLGQLLVDLHGQHDHQSLLDPDRHLGFLDAWIGAPVAEALSRVASLYSETEALRRRLTALRSGQRDREQRLDLLRYQIGEIESVAPKPGEMEELEGQLSRLKHAEKLRTASAGALEELRHGEPNASDLLGSALKSLQDAQRMDPSLDEILEPLRTAHAALDEGAYLLGRYASEIESDPELLEEVAGRIDSLRRLRRKYGDDEAAILAFCDAAQRELDELGDDAFDEASLTSSLAEHETALADAAAQLTERRMTGAAEFNRLVEEQLRQLAMEKARFEVSREAKAIEASGADSVQFYFSANQGEPLRPLSKIASGGEISRVMLAIKTGMAGRAGVPTLIFDEVDAGLGGRAAAVVAAKLEELAAHYQVVVISHVPQIAARALTHYRIEKSERGERVLTEVRPLTPEDRVEEIARMLAGEAIGETARTHAREMLAGRV